MCSCCALARVASSRPAPATASTQPVQLDNLGERPPIFVGRDDELDRQATGLVREKLLEMRWFERLYDFIMMIRDKAKALVAPIKQRIRDILRGDGEGWSARTLRLIQRFRRSVHEAR